MDRNTKKVFTPYAPVQEKVFSPCGPEHKKVLVDNHFTAHCEMIFAVINLQFAVMDLQFAVIVLQFAVIILQFAVIDLQNVSLLWNDLQPINFDMKDEKTLIQRIFWFACFISVINTVIIKTFYRFLTL